MQNTAVGTYIPSTENESRQTDCAAFTTWQKDWNALSLQLGLPPTTSFTPATKAGG